MQTSWPLQIYSDKQLSQLEAAAQKPFVLKWKPHYFDVSKEEKQKEEQEAEKNFVISNDGKKITFLNNEDDDTGADFEILSQFYFLEDCIYTIHLKIHQCGSTDPNLEEDSCSGFRIGVTEPPEKNCSSLFLFSFLSPERIRNTFLFFWGVFKRQNVYYVGEQWTGMV
jgi:hypothetical protein